MKWNEFLLLLLQLPSIVPQIGGHNIATSEHLTIGHSVSQWCILYSVFFVISESH